MSQDLHKNFTNIEQKRYKTKCKYKRWILFFLTFIGVWTQRVPCKVKVTYFARDPLPSYFDECQKNGINFLNNNDTEAYNYSVMIVIMIIVEGSKCITRVDQSINQSINQIMVEWLEKVSRGSQNLWVSIYANVRAIKALTHKKSISVYSPGRNSRLEKWLENLSKLKEISGVKWQGVSSTGLFNVPNPSATWVVREVRGIWS